MPRWRRRLHRWICGVELGWEESVDRRELRVVCGTPTDTDWSEVRWLSAGGPVVAGSARALGEDPRTWRAL